MRNEDFFFSHHQRTNQNRFAMLTLAIPVDSVRIPLDIFEMIMRFFWNNARTFERRGGATSFIHFILFSTRQRVHKSSRKSRKRIRITSFPELLTRGPPLPGPLRQVRQRKCRPSRTGLQRRGGRTTEHTVARTHGTDIRRARHRIERDERPRRRSFDRFRPSRTPRARRSLA